MKPKQSRVEFVLKEHTFLLLPTSIRSEEALQGHYFVELDKGCQKIGTSEEVFEFDRQRHAFQGKAAIAVKAYKEKGMNFSWTIYRSWEDIVEYTDSFQFSLQECFSEFTEEIRAYSFEYSRICQQRDCGQIIGESWGRMKSHLRKNRASASAKSTRGSFTLDFSIEIRNDLDEIAEREKKKALQLKIDRNRRSDSDLRSLSSRTEPREKDALQEEKGQERKIELKVESILKHDQEDEAIHVQVSQVDQEGRDIGAPERIDCNLLQAGAKEGTVLSDIIEASNEESHQHNASQHNEEHLIPEDNQSKSFAKTKTFHFQNENQGRLLKRNNSLESPKLQPRPEEEENEEGGLKIELTKSLEESTEASTVKQEGCEVKEENRGRLKYILLLLLGYGLIGYLLRAELPSEAGLLGGGRVHKRKVSLFE